MKRQEVYAVLGLPLEIRQNLSAFDFDSPEIAPGEIIECWTCTPNNSSYHVRQIVFNGEVVAVKHNEFYLD